MRPLALTFVLLFLCVGCVTSSSRSGLVYLENPLVFPDYRDPLART
jgi:uncharacterized protein YcfL